jgi:glycosyltransferase involved in cell wall biosynthesis
MVHLVARIIVGFLADHVVGCSQFLSESLELPRRVYTIYYPFRLKPLGPARSGNAPFVLFCGRIDRSKGLLEIIEALRVLRQRGQSIRLLVAGDGPEMPLARQHAADAKLDDSIEWLGRIGSDEVARLMCCSRVVLVPSISNDPSPFVVLEAGSVERPVIGSSKGGIPEEVHDGGWIVDPADREWLATAIWRAWDSPEECAQRGAALRRHVESVFDAERSTQALLALLESGRAAETFGAIPHHGRW